MTGWLRLTHLQAMVLFALLVSIGFGFLGRRRPAARARYMLWTFFLFLVVGIAIGWAMYPFSH